MMKTFLITLFFTFVAFVLTATIVNFCRKKLQKSKHGLTGMCHRSGGAACSGCVNTEAKNG